MVYALAIAVILCPIPIVLILTSSMSRQAKTLVVICTGAFFLIVPDVVYILANSGNT